MDLLIVKPAPKLTYQVKHTPSQPIWGPLGPFGGQAPALIGLHAGDDASYPTAGFKDIALVAGDEVDMGMGHGLAGGSVDVDTYIEPIGVELLLEDGFDLIQQDEAVRLLLEGQIEVIGNVPGGDHQGMPLAHRELIKNRIDRCGFSNHRPIGWEGTEGAG
jgi:hypothetical protein